MQLCSGKGSQQERQYSRENIYLTNAQKRTSGYLYTIKAWVTEGFANREGLIGIRQGLPIH